MIHLIHRYRTVGMVGFRRYQECRVCGKRRALGGPSKSAPGVMPVDRAWLNREFDHIVDFGRPPLPMPRTGSRGAQPIGNVKPIPPSGVLEELPGIYRSPQAADLSYKDLERGPKTEVTVSAGWPRKERTK